MRALTRRTSSPRVRASGFMLTLLTTYMVGVLVLAGPRGSSAETIPTFAGSTSTEISEDGETAFVLNPSNSTVSVVDTENSHIVEVVSLNQPQNQAHAMSIDPGLTKPAIVSTSVGKVLSLDLGTGDVTLITQTSGANYVDVTIDNHNPC